MKNVLSVTILAALVFTVGCASTGTTNTQTSTTTPITLEQAMKQSAQARQKVENAKTNYQTAKTAVQAGQTGGNVASELAKQAVQNQVNVAKQQVDTEVQAWKDVLKN